jgi:hypothetical protein
VNRNLTHFYVSSISRSQPFNIFVLQTNQAWRS